MQLRSVKRLFRASEHDFSPAAFHLYCDNKENTLVLVRTEHGKTIGGFTRYPWTSDDWDYGWVENLEGRDFMFSLDMKEKFVPQKNSCSRNIVLSQSSAAFGGRSDLQVSTWRVSNRLSTCSFPDVFNRAGENKLEDNGETR